VTVSLNGNEEEFYKAFGLGREIKEFSDF